MKHDLTRELTVEEMANLINLSPTQFSRMFKAEVGVPPARYLKQFRLETAKGLLTSSYLRVKEIMFKVGLKDESRFVRDFKTVYGVTPKQYRMNNSLSNINQPS
jgi:transcriptional regulator GlxA family with amidase domain